MCCQSEISLGCQCAFLCALHPRYPILKPSVTCLTRWSTVTTRNSSRFTHFHTIMFSAGTYFAFPTPTLLFTLVVFNGVGILNTTLLAFSLGSNDARRWMVYSTRDLVGSVTWVCSRNGRLIFVVDRYLLDVRTQDLTSEGMELTHFMSSNSPSGGINEIDRSVSNLPNRTHW